ncbi:UNVERIFIED_CONTAM: hypothetical protein Slati_2282200 [Sesamum latifolium]|uniref:Uncharacterized protein n=1 Tax=Sesamum latifolium TaxID=2727402 RepID=A0AAW2W8S0_9LAMI
MSRNQNPSTNIVIAPCLTPGSRESPKCRPISAAKPISRTPKERRTVPDTRNGRRRPKRDVHQSLWWPTIGWTTNPDIGPQSQIKDTHLCFRPKSCVYGVKSDSCNATRTARRPLPTLPALTSL